MHVEVVANLLNEALFAYTALPCHNNQRWTVSAAQPSYCHVKVYFSSDVAGVVFRHSNELAAHF